MINQKDHNKFSWSVIDKMFQNDPNHLVNHHLTSYNNFFSEKIKNVMKDNNPVILLKDFDEDLNDYNLKCYMYFGGKDGSKLYYGKPILYDNEYEHIMFPNEARLKNKTYGFNIYYDIDVDFVIKDSSGEIVEKELNLKKISLGMFPIMLQSDLCVLKNLTPQARFNSGECVNDKGGYFIIDGKEKVIVCQEQFANNAIYIKENVSDVYSYGAEIRSVSENTSKPIRTTSVRIVAPTVKKSNNQIVVLIPNVRSPIPLFIVFRALGVISDKEIIRHCLLNLEKYSDYMELFAPSVHDAGHIFTQENAIKYISTFTKHKTIPSTMDILMNYFIPHMGEMHFTQKAMFLGHMVFKLLRTMKNVDKATDRDSFKCKRIETTGSLINDLFREYYREMLAEIRKRFDKEYYFKEKGNIYEGVDFSDLIENNYISFFKEKGFIVQRGLMKAFKGQWGSKAYTSKEGIVQDLNRLSFNSVISHCRKLSLPLDPTAKVVAPRLLHSSQYGFIDPVDTPDGGHIGLHKYMAISTVISNSTSIVDMVEWLKQNDVLVLTQITLFDAERESKVFVNGSWIGVHRTPFELCKKFNVYKRNGIIPVFSTISFNIRDNIIEVFCDSGRLLRPIYHVSNENKPSYSDLITSDKFKKVTWTGLVCGTTYSKEKSAINYSKILKVSDVYESPKTSTDEMEKSEGIVEYIDSSVLNTSLINTYDFGFSKKYTHMEIHPSLMLGVMGNQVIYPNHNPVSRDLFSCGQSKQAVSLYSSNYQYRTDKMSVILNYGQIPLVKSRYLRYINNEEHPYGENVIVAIMSYNGYNVEDSILFNGASIDRGLFRTTYFSTYDDKEELTLENDVVKSSTLFSNIEQHQNLENTLMGFEYHNLDENGFIKEETRVHDKVAIIGKVTKFEDTLVNKSTKVKKGQLGIVDKVFVSNNSTGYRNCKVRIREERIPNIGDKFCSRCGQKGTVGLIIPEKDMPFTSTGVRPDIIINPHALPSRMTIGQLIETITGKGSCLLGSFADCTAFEDTGMTAFRDVLKKKGYHSYGNEVLYDGLSGNQIESDIFIGPTYYMRLKHMVKDKINHRAGGPRDSLTRQTVQGRANDGGLRIGEMERDALVSHGIMTFLKNSMVDRGDKFYLAICNHSGTIAIFNSSKNIMFSPYVDGPIVFNDGDLLNSEHCQSYTTQFGKEFSIIQIPYSLKLLMQELTTINVQMRIITSDNIESLTSKKPKSFSVSGKYIRKQITDLDKSGTFNLAGNNENTFETNNANDKDENDDDFINDHYDYNNLNETIVQHTIFNVGDTVVYVPSKSTRPWKIKDIDNSKKHDNIVIFTLLMGDLSDHQDLPPNSVIQNKIFNKSNQTLSTPVFLTVSIEDIVHFGKDGKLNHIAIKNTRTNIPITPIAKDVAQRESNQDNTSEVSGSQDVVKLEDNNESTGNNEESSGDGDFKSDSTIKTIKLN